MPPVKQWVLKAATVLLTLTKWRLWFKHLKALSQCSDTDFKHLNVTFSPGSAWEKFSFSRIDQFQIVAHIHLAILVSFLQHFMELYFPCGLFTKNKMRKIAFFCNFYFAQNYFYFLPLLKSSWSKPDWKQYWALSWHSLPTSDLE